MSKLYKGQTYWTIGWRLGSMEPKEVIFHDDDLDKVRAADGNMFETEDKALVALARVKAALRNGCDATCRYLRGHKLEPGDIIAAEGKTGYKHVLQYVNDDWFYDIKRDNEHLHFFAIVHEHELNDMQVTGIYRPDGFTTIFLVVDGIPVPQHSVVWEADKAREMTIADIEKELGYRIKVVKES